MTSEQEQKKILAWETFYLPNIPIYQTKLNDDIVERLWKYIDASNVNYNESLAGNITESKRLVDQDDWFFKKVIEPITSRYCETLTRSQGNPYNCKSKRLIMSDFWVNFQNQNEFNPIHYHSGIVSFVIWMKIPTEAEEQHNHPLCANSNSPSASDFQFIYSDILGEQQDHRVKMGKIQEGWIVLFPSRLRHQVYPFYDCDQTRVSISGNVYFNTRDIEIHD